MPRAERARAWYRMIRFSCRPVVPMGFQQAVKPDIPGHRDLEHIIDD